MSGRQDLRDIYYSMHTNAPMTSNFLVDIFLHLHTLYWLLRSFVTVVVFSGITAFVKSREIEDGSLHNYIQSLIPPTRTIVDIN